MKSDIEIARETDLRKIKEVATTLGIPREEVQNYGRYIAKVPIHLIDKKQMDQHNLILVTAITPTKAGIGKTTVSIGLALGLNKIGKKAVVALREPSLGPCFGMKGGAAGGGPGRIRRKGSGRAVQYAGQPGKCGGGAGQCVRAGAQQAQDRQAGTKADRRMQEAGLCRRALQTQAL